MVQDRRAALADKIAGLSPEKQQLLRSRLAGAAAHAFSEELKPGCGGTGDFPLSQTQQGFWFMNQLEPGGHMFNLPAVMRAYGELRVPIVRRVLAEILKRHELLRARVINGTEGPLLRIEAEMEVSLREIDLSALPEDQREAEMRRIATAEARAPFDFATGPLLRMLIIRERPDQNVICFTFHHLVCDGWSIDLFVKEAIALYSAFSEGLASPLPEVRFRYADYVAWQRRYLDPARLDGQLGFWRETLRGAPELLELPRNHARPAVPSRDGGVAVVVVGREDVERAVGFSRRLGLTPFMTYLGAFGVLLARYSGQSEVLIGTPVFNRPRKEFEELIGLFINTVVVRCDLTHNPTVQGYLTEGIQKQVLDAFSHQDAPFHQVVRAVSPERRVNHSPVFQVLFSYQSYSSEAKVNLGGVRVRGLDGIDSKATYDLTFELRNREDGGLLIVAEFATELFDRAAVIRLLNHYTGLLRAMIETPERCVRNLPMLSSAEQKLLLAGFNQTRADYPAQSCYQELFRDVAAEHSAAPAAVEASVSLSYGELDARSDALAARLRNAGVTPHQRVVLVQERGIELLISILATFKAGGAYVPIEPGTPPERIAQIVRHSEAPVLLAGRASEPRLRELERRGAWGDTTRVLYYEPESSARTAEISERIGQPTDLAYCIFTSGSTGVPKGAMIEQRGMINHMYAKIADLCLTDQDVIAATASPAFDISVWQYLSVLLVGGKLVFFDDETTHSSSLFIRRLVEAGVTVVEIVPSFFRVLLDELETLGERRPHFKKLRWLVLTGEALPAALCNRWLALYPGIPVANAYGPTECSDDVTHHFVREPLPSETEIVPIGRPIANTQIYVVDPCMQPVPIGVSGEIVVGGAGVGRGYLNDPERTDQAFLADPFLSGTGNRVYRTSDLGRFRADGTLEFLGRLDHQVKIRGFRIELGEIETVLGRHAAVREVAVVARDEQAGDRRLVAYVVPSASTTPTPGELRDFLKETLPDYLLPAAFVMLEKLPLTRHGKLDRAALPAPNATVDQSEAGFVAARTAIEEVLARIWAEALGRERVGVHDDFFALGGHSLITVALVERVQKAFQVQLSVRDLFGATTVAKLARIIEGELRDGAFTEVAVKDLETEALLEDAIRPNGPMPDPGAEPKCILLTGASGFLGAFLLHDLLQETQAEIYCLVRAENEAEGKQKLRRALESRSIWDARSSSRIIPVLGDLELPRLGLTERQFESLARKIDVIYHNGAWINLLYPYRTLKAANVAGTREILRLAVEKKVKPVHHVSTLSVFSLGKRTLDLVREDEKLEDVSGLHGGYAQSKWVAEKMVLTAGSRGLPVCIYRPHRITGHSRTGVWNRDDLAYQLLKACIDLGIVPERDSLVEMTPVDYVSRAIVHLSRQRDAWGKAFHLLNPKSAPLNQVVDWIRALGYPLEQIPRAEWQAKIFEEAQRSPQSALYPLGYLMSERHPEPGMPPLGPRSMKKRLRFDVSNTERGLSGTAISCPPVDAPLIQNAFRYLSRSGLLPKPATRTGVRGELQP